MSFYEENRKLNSNARLDLDALGIRGVNLKEAFLAFCNNPHELEPEKIKANAQKELDAAKHLRQVDDQARLFINPGVEEGPDRWRIPRLFQGGSQAVHVGREHENRPGRETTGLDLRCRNPEAGSQPLEMGLC